MVFGDGSAPTDASIKALPQGIWSSFGYTTHDGMAAMPNSLLTVTLASNFGTFLLYGLSCVICFVAYHKHPNFSIIRHLAIPIFGLVANLACMAFYLVGPFMGMAQRWSHCWRWGSPPSGRSTRHLLHACRQESRPYYTGDESSGSLTRVFDRSDTIRAEQINAARICFYVGIEFAQASDCGRSAITTRIIWAASRLSGSRGRTLGYLFALADAWARRRWRSRFQTGGRTLLQDFRRTAAGVPHSSLLPRLVQQANTRVFEPAWPAARGVQHGHHAGCLRAPL